MNRSSYDYEREIDLKDMFFSILKHYRAIIIAMIIGMVVMGGYGIYKSYTDNKLLQAAEIGNTEKLDTEYLDHVANQIIANNTLIQSEENYLEKSVLMQDGMDDVYYGEEKYRVWIDNGSVDDLELLVNYYISSVKSEMVFSNISALLGNVDEKYISEIIDAKCESEIENSNDIMFSQQKNSAVITISIIGPNSEFVKKVSGYINEYFNNLQFNITQKVGKHKMELICSNVYSKYIYDNDKKRATISDEILNRAKQNNDLLKDLNDSQKQYINNIIQNTTNDVEKKSTDNYKKVSTVTPQISMAKCIKWAVIGVVLGLFVVVAWFGMSYVLSNVIYTKNEIDTIYGVNSYAWIVNDNSTSIIDKWRYSGVHFWSDDEIVDIICNTVKASQIKKVAIVSCGDLTEYEWINRCVEKSEGCIQFVKSNAVYATDFVKKISAVEGVIVLEQLGIIEASKCTMLKNRLTENGVKVIGAVVLCKE